MAVSGILFVLSIGVSIYFYIQNKKLIANPQAAVEKETQDIVRRIGGLVDIPGEKPSVITVVDREKLDDQEFFKKAQNGDKIIVFEGARRIILYRPSSGKIVDMIPLVFQSPTPKPQEAQDIPLAPSQPPVNDPGAFGQPPDMN